MAACSYIAHLASLSLCLKPHLNKHRADRQRDSEEEERKRGREKKEKKQKKKQQQQAVKKKKKEEVKVAKRALCTARLGEGSAARRL